MYRHLFPFLLFESSNLSTILKQLTVQISTVLAAREPVLRTQKRKTPHACRAEAVRDSAEEVGVSKEGGETA